MSAEVPRYSRVEIQTALGSPDGLLMVVSGDGDELVRVTCDSYVWVRDYGELVQAQRETIKVAGYVPAGDTDADTVDGA